MNGQGRPVAPDQRSSTVGRARSVDLDQGGHVGDGSALAALSVCAAVAHYLQRHRAGARKQEFT